MKIHFLGATRTTTGSMYLIEINGKRLLLECGLFQGHREETTQRNCCFPFDPRQIDAVVLSHAHIDHSGNLPNLVRQGYDGPIHCTDATRDLCSIMLIDSAHIQEQDALFVSKWRAKKHQPPVEPLYHRARRRESREAAGRAPLRPDVFPGGRRDGHVQATPGTSWVPRRSCWIFRTRARKFRWLFSGDIGRGGDDILRDPVPVEDVDYLQIESTYGGREHTVRKDADDTVCQLVGGALNQKGKVIIPSFSVGRTQQIVYVLHQITLTAVACRACRFSWTAR